MGRVLGIDYGAKRCGIAVTDPLRISINPLKVLPPQDLLPYLQSYLESEQVDVLSVGWPTHADGNETHLSKEISTFLVNFAKLYPTIRIVKVDESYTSSEAKAIIFHSGARKKKRKEKALVDQVSAVLIIKRYLEDL